MKIEYLAIMLVLSILAAPALGAPQVVPLGQYNVTLDLGDKAVTAEPKPSASTLSSEIHSTVFRGDGPSDYGTISLYYYETAPISTADERLWGTMKAICRPVRFPNAGTIGDRSGLITTGDAMVAHGFGQRCYGALVPLPSQGKSLVEFLVIGHFTNETLNEQFVKTARISQM